MPQLKDSSILLKIGGSLIFKKDGIKTKTVQKFAEFLASHPTVKIVVIGGGILARWFIQAAREWGVSEAECDLLGIYQSRMNARLLISAIKRYGRAVYPEPPQSIEEVGKALTTQHLVVMGGLQPGQSTTSVAFETTEYARIRNLWVLTDVNGIFDSDPRKNPSATKFDTISVPDLEKIVDAGSSQAGEYRIFDAVSLQILKRSDLRVRVLNGDKLNELDALIEDPSLAIGTSIQP